ncbi:amidase [Marinobacter subterrani]|uniref:Asp-tRNAAsn/Glu-tRNAGln amidotransferase A subunit n=1 Tax=Marinobacter subterrani TaxID=1658765 RepID=A0A0J7LVW5_9GAMM|nr:amidase [Marinobacter subterrani]KMQ73045.1 Asp-tRNAAsn/Glu-tRNAGln amidotransferase A subunit [Marinobacter subterrani]
MKQSEYLRYDATALADLVRRGEVSAREVCEAAVERATRVNGKLNAICYPQFSEALGQSFPGQSVFAGVPLLLKDLAQEQAGHPCTYGSRGLKKNVAPVDSEFVRRARQGGLVILGRTATPEFGLKAITESELWGATRNPWNTGLTPGGSSGGSGAAVAAGIVPMAGANDGGGSIRIPAAYNGLFGLKPSRGRISSGPFMGEAWTGASTDHVVSRTVRDSAAMLDVLSGPAAGDPFRISAPEAAYADLMQKSPGSLRIGVFTASPYNTEVAPECVAAVEETARVLENLGHKVEYAAPELDGMALARCYLGLYFGEVSALMAKAREQFGATDSDFELDTRLIGMLGESMPLSDYVRRRQQWNEFARALGNFFGRFDLYLSPTTAQLPAAIGALETPPHLKLAARLMLRLSAGKLVHRSGQVDQMAMESLARTPFTQLANLTGTPAMSMPTHWSDSGLPVGVQFGAPHGGEAVLLQLAAQLEEASPWFSNYERLEEAF